MAAGGGAEGNRLCPPPSAGAVRWAPNATGAALAPHPAFAGAGQSRPLVLRGGRAMRGLLLCGGWLLAAGCLVGASGSCRHRCCPGRNNACWVLGVRRAHCYCDSYCQRTGDCCQDYHSVCRRAAVGCAVGPWGPWSGCSSPCGVGSKARSRQVTVPPRHGGEPCPDLKQRRGCLGEHPTCGTAKARTSGIPGEELGCCCWRSRPGRAPVPRAGLEPPAAPEQASVCRVPGGHVPTPSPLHRARAAGSQDILGGCLRGRVSGLVGAGEAAGGLCLLPTSSHLRVAPPGELSRSTAACWGGRE
ncbi:SCO-spondin-like isoform X2 [Pezoporus flaviventris]|uniref:SCO-spondin-like isoform X2 n=1 Tax=Pezoporus flaviventris TaxID=889875 RepID=UPI002AAFF937|nr:SCO-spondin-like isoform X2 [Pezoporus flaviventris]